MSAIPAIRSGITNGSTDKNAHTRSTTAQSGTRVFQEVFNAPGTWTWPGRVSGVEVLIVSGGGGGQTGPTTPPLTVAISPTAWAGSGGVGVFTVPVSGPVPVTVGAGGTAVAYPATPALGLQNGGNGGSSAFGSLTPPIPINTAWLEGGLGAGQPAPTYPYVNGGGSNSNTGIVTKFADNPSGPNYGASAGRATPDDNFGTTKYNYGMGARPDSQQTYGRGSRNAGHTATPHLNNLGHAGASFNNQPTTPQPVPVAFTGDNGSSGVVIVRWVE